MLIGYKTIVVLGLIGPIHIVFPIYTAHKVHNYITRVKLLRVKYYSITSESCKDSFLLKFK